MLDLSRIMANPMAVLGMFQGQADPEQTLKTLIGMLPEDTRETMIAEADRIVLAIKADDWATVEAIATKYGFANLVPVIQTWAARWEA